MHVWNFKLQSDNDLGGIRFELQDVDDKRRRALTASESGSNQTAIIRLRVCVLHAVQ